MLTANEYMAIKGRMLLAAEAAGLIARTQDDVRFDDETYPLVLNALTNNKDDVRRILAECDILRHMSHQSIFPVAGEPDASLEPTNNRGTLDSVPPPSDEGGRTEIQPDHAGDGGPVQAVGTDGGSEVPKPRRNRKRKAVAPEPVERADADGQVGG
jgi:hypothetical protein